MGDGVPMAGSEETGRLIGDGRAGRSVRSMIEKLFRPRLMEPSGLKAASPVGRTTGAATIFSTVYVSTAAVPFSDDDVAALLATSRKNNAALDITGMLLLKDQQFMQALEGPEAAVRALIAKISADDRHTDFWTLSEEQRQIRQFPEWTMGFRGLTDESIRALPGYDTFFDAAPDAGRAWATKSRALWLLDRFHSHRM